ncbi:MAG: NBR1-Ig-like domain-containing protein [Melioribacteraceae bacterium]|nr:NBR1-Ig-like domain-containing protein [Melioribacteraceae bacterium]
MKFEGDTQYSNSQGDGTLTYDDKKNTVIKVTNASGKWGKSITLTAKLQEYGTILNTDLANKVIKFYVDNTYVNQATTNTSGDGSVTYTIPSSWSEGTKGIKVTFDGDASYNSQTSTGTLTVQKHATSVTVANKSGVVGQQVALEATLKDSDNSSSGVSGKVLKFYQYGLITDTPLGQATTNSSGTATYSWTVTSTILDGNDSTRVITQPISQSKEGSEIKVDLVNSKNEVLATKTIRVKFEGDTQYSNSQGDGTLTTSIDPNSKPDLVIEKIFTTPLTPEKKGTYDVNVIVKNRGNSRANIGLFNDINCLLTIEGVRYEITYDDLGINETKTLTKSGLTAPEKETIIITADADLNNEIDELDEKNNTNSILVTLREPPKADLVIQNVIIEPTQVIKGQNFKITVVIKNDGNLEANAGFLKNIECQITGDLTAEIFSYNNLKPGDTYTGSKSFIAPNNKSSLNLIIDCDYNNDINESNENNNKLNKQIELYDPPMPKLLVEAELMPFGKMDENWTLYIDEKPVKNGKGALTAEATTGVHTYYGEIVLGSYKARTKNYTINLSNSGTTSNANVYWNKVELEVSNNGEIKSSGYDILVNNTIQTSNYMHTYIGDGNSSIPIKVIYNSNEKIKYVSYNGLGISKQKFEFYSNTTIEQGLISYENYPENSTFKPGESFIKTWIIKNTGNTIWDEKYKFTFETGSLSNDKNQTFLPNKVPSGQTIKFEKRMAAPLVPGVYTETWKLSNAAGNIVGLGQDQKLITKIKVEQNNSYLVLTINPNSKQVVGQNERVSFSITVNDNMGNLIENSLISVEDEISKKTSTILTNSQGKATYETGTILSGVINGTQYQISFKAQKAGLKDSEAVKRYIEVFNQTIQPPSISIQNKSIAFYANASGTLPEKQVIKINNSGGGTLMWQIEGIPGWLSVDKINGLGNENEINIQPITTMLDPSKSPFETQLIIKSSNAVNSGLFSINVKYYITSNITKISIGDLQINANSISTTQSGKKVASGNVNINNILLFSGNLTVDEVNGNIEGNCEAYLINIPIVNYVKLLNGSFELKLQGKNSLLANAMDNAFGLELGKLKVKFNDVELLTDGIRIGGYIDFKQGFQVKANFNNLTITKSRGFEFEGDLIIRNVKLFSGIELDYLKLGYNSSEEKFYGTTFIKSKVINVGGKVVFIGGRLEEIEINAEGFNIPLGPTPFALVGASGGVSGLVNPPTKLSLSADISTVDPLISKIIKLDDVGLDFIFEPITIGGYGGIKLFNKYDIARAKIEFSYPKYLQFSGEVNLADYFIGNTSLTIQFVEPKKIYGSSSGKIQIPEFKEPKFLAKCFEIWNVDFPIVLMQSENYFENYKFWGNFSFRWYKSLGYLIDFEPVVNGNLPKFKISINADNLNPDLFGTVNNYNAGNGNDKFEGLSVKLEKSLGANKLGKTTGNAFEKIIPLRKNIQEMIIRLESNAPISNILITDPNGNSYASQQSGIDIIKDNLSKTIFCYINSPSLGNWKIECESNEEIILDVIGTQPDIIVEINKPDFDTNTRDIKWNFYNLNGTGKISLFFDNDNQGFDGQLIVSDLSVQNGSGSYNWNDWTIPSGSYYIYAIASDEKGLTGRTYSLSRIIINSNISQPKQLIASTDNSGIVLNWQRPENEIIKGFSMKYWETNNPFEIKIFSIGDTNNVMINDLIAGREYQFGIATISNYEQVSDYILSNKVTYSKLNLNNSPTITSNRNSTIKATTNIEFKYQVTANDIDGDILTYSFKEAPNDAIINFVNGEISWIPKIQDMGNNKFNIRVSDGKGGIDSLIFSIQVIEYQLSSISFDRLIYSIDRPTCIVTINDLLYTIKNPNNNTLGVTLETSQASFPIICKKQNNDSHRFIGIVDLRLLDLKNSDSIVVVYNNSFGEIIRSVAGWIESIVSVENNDTNIPTEFTLFQNYPNPFNPGTTVKYRIPIRCHVELEIFDILGRKIRTLVNELKEPGEYSSKFIAKGEASGVYIYRIKAGDYISVKKFILLK